METMFGRSRRFLLIAASAATMAACTMATQPSAQVAQGTGRQCFFVSQVKGFNAVNRDTVQVTVGPNSVYELKLFDSCPEIDWSLRIGIRSTGGGSSVCNGLDAELLVPSPLGVQRCPVTNIRRLTPAEVQASRSRRKR